MPPSPPPLAPPLPEAPACFGAASPSNPAPSALWVDLAPSPGCLDMPNRSAGASTNTVHFSQLVSSSPNTFVCDSNANRAEAQRRPVWLHRKALLGHARRQQTVLSDIGVGLMVTRLAVANRGKYESAGSACRAGNLLACAFATWLAGKETSTLEVVLLLDCHGLLDAKNTTIGKTTIANTTLPPAELQRPLWFRHSDATVHVQCYIGTKTRPPLYAGNGRKMHSLLVIMLQLMPNKRFYLKLDPDTVAFPLNLMRFLSTLDSHLHPDARLYFGSSQAGGNASDVRESAVGYTFKSSDEAARVRSRAMSKSRLARRLNASRSISAGTRNTEKKAQQLRLRETHAWRDLEENLAKGEESLRNVRGTDYVKYAIGGAYGMNHAALHAAVASDCLYRVARVPFKGRRKSVHTIEDATFGLCMHLLGARLIECGCFRNGIFGNPSGSNLGPNWALAELKRELLPLLTERSSRGLSAARELAATRPLICPNPITVHPVKDPFDFQRWFDLFSDQALAGRELGRWEGV